METTALPLPHARKDTFYSAIAGLMLTLLFTAFSTRYFLRGFTDEPSLPWFVHAHALMFTSWMALFLVQATLIRSGAIALHRKAGIGGMSLAVLIVVLGVYSAVEGARRGHNPARFSDALSFMIVGLTDITLFACFIAGAWWCRRQRELHKRLVLLAMIGGFAWPIIVRLPFVIGQFPLALGLLTVLAMAAPLTSALTRQRIHPVDVVGGIVIVLSVPLRRLVGETDAWRQFAGWLVG